MRKSRPKQPASVIRTAAFETLERRCLLSATVADPIAYPLDGTLSGGASAPPGYSPSQIASTYGINKVTLNGVVGNGTGQTIAIVMAYDDPGLVSSTDSTFDQSDLHIFDQQFGLPDPTFTKVEQFEDGSYPSPDTGWAIEASLDVEWTHAIAPGAKILLVEAHDPDATSLLDYGVKTAAATSGVSVVNMSFGFTEFASETSYDSDFLTPSGHAGVTFVAATGDSGGAATYPAFSPNVVAVGGTTLSSTSLSSETAYDSSSGGISQYESKPAYQSAVTQSSTNRTNPDVSFDGNPNTGVSVYDSYNGGFADKWYKIGGTSFSAPAWAALIAIADQGRAGAKLSSLDGRSQTLPNLYSMSASNYHDITSGNNGYAAGPGYDLVTGRGSPIANLLEPALAGVPATAALIASASITGEIYVDTNNNGKLDTGETGLSGVKVYLDTNKNGTLDASETFITTGTGGTFSFGSLAAGTYQIREVVPANHKLTSPSAGYYDVTVAAGGHVTGENFGNVSTVVVTPPAPRYIDSISGYLYIDTNKNGKFDTGETALAGVTVFIDTNHDGKLDDGEESTVTNAAGYYYLGETTAATFRVMEVLPTGYKLTGPTAGYYDVPLKGGWNVKNVDFGIVKS